MVKTQEKLNDVTYLRVFAVISLVAWHSYCSYTAWEIGNSPLDRWYTIVFRFFAPTANMPLFTYLSGYLFCYLLKEKGKYSEFNGFLKNKVNRLLVPYIVLGFIINFTQIGRGKPLLPLFFGAPNHMWYCLMLFYCFLICWFVEKKYGTKINIIIASLSFLFVLVAGNRYLSVSSPLGIYMVIYFYCYFYMGFLVFQNADKIFPILWRYRVYIVLLFICSTVFVGMNHHAEGVSAVLFILLLTTFAKSIKKTPSRLIEVIAKYSFGIYVFHQWIIWNVTRFEAIQPIIQEHYVLFPIMLFISVFLLCMLLTHFSIKTRVGRYLLT